MRKYEKIDTLYQRDTTGTKSYFREYSVILPQNISATMIGFGLKRLTALTFVYVGMAIL